MCGIFFLTFSVNICFYLLTMLSQWFLFFNCQLDAPARKCVKVVCLDFKVPFSALVYLATYSQLPPTSAAKISVHILEIPSWVFLTPIHYQNIFLQFQSSLLVHNFFLLVLAASVFFSLSSPAPPGSGRRNESLPWNVSKTASFGNNHFKASSNGHIFRLLFSTNAEWMFWGIQVPLKTSFVHVTDPNTWFIKKEITLCSLCCCSLWFCVGFVTILVVWSVNCEGHSTDFFLMSVPVSIWSSSVVFVIELSYFFKFFSK